jgi:pyruvate/2-oxoglutarate dehydrogenase complex dihydrolipoamide acyltransferase (E2) component
MCLTDGAIDAQIFFDLGRLLVLNSQNHDSDAISETKSAAPSFSEITRRSTRHIELLNNLAPKHRIYGLVEIDVTKARRFISEYEAKTGEKLSFTAWVIRCVSQAVSEHREVQALKKGKKKLVVFDDVDVGIIIEKQRGSEKYATSYCVRKANEKSFKQIHDEIRLAQNSETDETKRASASLSLPLRIRGLLGKPFWWKLKSDPFVRKQMMGTVAVTAVGMFGKGGGWAIPIGLHPLVVAVGGIAKKPRDYANPSEIGEFLSTTVMFDEEISLGAPATRFLARFAELMQTGFGLEVI